MNSGYILNGFIEKVYEKIFLLDITCTIVNPQIFLAGIAGVDIVFLSKVYDHFDRS